MTEFATGLMIGKVKSNFIYSIYKNVSVICNLWLGHIGASEGEEASKRRKQRYKLELLQQIAEKEKNKRRWEMIWWLWVFELKPFRAKIFTWPSKLKLYREKELELRVAATGADPEKKVKVVRFLIFDKSLFYILL